MQEKYGFVYIWFDRSRKRYYIGCHWGTEDDGYISSSTWMRNAYRKRPQDFKRRILARVYTDRKDLFEEEFRFLNMIKNEELKVKYYNLSRVHPHHWSTDPNSAKTVKQKLKEAWTDERRQIQSPKLSRALKGNTNKRDKRLSDESKKKMSDSKMGHTYNRGIPKSTETKRKISETAKSQNRVGTFKGKAHSEESKKKMSDSKKGKVAHNKGIPSSLRGKPGRKWTEEQKLAASIARRGKPSPKKGIPLSEEHKSKLKEAKNKTDY